MIDDSYTEFYSYCGVVVDRAVGRRGRVVCFSGIVPTAKELAASPVGRIQGKPKTKTRGDGSATTTKYHSSNARIFPR